MKIYSGYNNYYSNTPKSPQTVDFGAAKDINLRYILRNHSHLLPERMNAAADSFVVKTESMDCLPTLKDLHEMVYSGLMSAPSLDEAKKLYPEFAEVVELPAVAKKVPRLIAILGEKIPLSEFSFDLLKKVWSGMPQEEIAKTYGFSGRAPVSKLCNLINIPKPNHNYLTLLKTSDEAGNQRVADASRRHLSTSMRNLALANIANKTPEARAKQAASIVRHYEEHPERREEASRISRLTWQKCPQIREAKTKYFLSLSTYQKVVLKKQSSGAPLTAQERRVVASVHKGFWDLYPEFKAIYAEARIEAVREVRLSSLTDRSCDMNTGGRSLD